MLSIDCDFLPIEQPTQDAQSQIRKTHEVVAPVTERCIEQKNASVDMQAKLGSHHSSEHTSTIIYHSTGTNTVKDTPPGKPCYCVHSCVLLPSILIVSGNIVRIT